MFLSEKQVLITGNGFAGFWLPERLVADQGALVTGVSQNLERLQDLVGSVPVARLPGCHS
jgi:nucleoside-diphosphate-sugar epimerase